jgi:hypothetical protein
MIGLHNPSLSEVKWLGIPLGIRANTGFLAISEFIKYAGFYAMPKQCPVGTGFGFPIV